MQVDELQTLQDKISTLEKKLKAAESQCQATTREIWQMENELANWEDRAKAAEERVRALEESQSEPAELESLRAQLATAQEELHQLAPLQARLTEANMRLQDLTNQLEEAEAQVRAARSLESELADLRFRLSASNDDQVRTRHRIQELESELASRGESRGDTQQLEELQSRLSKAEERAELASEKASLLQERSDRLQERLGLAEDKANIYQQRADQAEERLRDTDNRARTAEQQAAEYKERLSRLETRVRDADQIFAAADEQKREAEALKQESWQRIRDAETRANQAVVEAKKLADRLAEYEKRAQESDRETQRLAFQDPLTGLPNLNLISQYLDFTVKQSVRYKRVAALLVVDLDRFKVFNEAMGQKAGDEMLVQVTERLKTAVRETDSLGRKGEDEFIILLSEINIGENFATPDQRRATIQQHVQVVAHRVAQCLAAPITVQGQKFFVQASVGIAVCPDDGDTPQTLLENADTAMYHAKESGRNCFVFYSTDLRKRQEKRLTLDNQIRYALERGEFQVLYHPVISLAKGKTTCVGAEALIRWQHRIDGLVGPEYFLAGAEESGMIIPIGHYVLRETCRQLREWLANGLKIFASTNLSKRQLMQADLIENLTAILQESGVPPDLLYVEIAEGFNTFNPELMDQVVQRLGQTGVRIAIDDFGIGYSSLGRINLAHTRIIKIDKSIIGACPNDKQAVTIAIAAINLASSLGVLSLAEGVENAAQAKFLIKYGCDLAQGNFFEQPMSGNEVLAMVRNKKTWKV